MLSYSQCYNEECGVTCRRCLAFETSHSLKATKGIKTASVNKASKSKLKEVNQ